MSDSTTPNYGLVKPAIGASRDTWGTKENQNADTIDTAMHSTDTGLAQAQISITSLLARVSALEQQIGAGAEMVGSIKPWPMNGGQGPLWFPCNGMALAPSQFPELFAVIGNWWGGDGINTFNLPNFFGRTLVGPDGGTGNLGGLFIDDNVGRMAGVPAYALQPGEAPAHSHSATTTMQPDHTHTFYAWQEPMTQPEAGQGGRVIELNTGGQYQWTTDPAGGHNHTLVTDTQGGNLAHINLQPSVIVMWIIKVRSQ
jgi:microcystin-dependent protein